jgi:DNA-binding NtrC family response regulator
MSTAKQPVICVIDDEERIRRLLIEALEDYEEFSLLSAGSAEEALELLSATPADLCIVDMRLPGISGEKFILQAWERGLCPRFLLHSGSMDLSLSEDLQRLGMTDKDVFLKPATTDHMVIRMRQLLQAKVD